MYLNLCTSRYECCKGIVNLSNQPSNFAKTEVRDMLKHNFTGFTGLFYGTLAIQFEK